MNMKHTVLCLLLGAISLPSLAAEGDIPRRPDGKPDLEGTYDIAWLTPLQRAPKYGESPYISEEEARSIAHNAAASYEKSIAPIDGDRPAPPVGGDGHASNIGGHNTFWWDRGTGAFAFDGKYRNSILTDPPDGRLPPLSQQGQEQRARRPGNYNHNPGGAWWLDEGKILYDHPEVQSLGTRCLYSGGSTVPMRPSAYNNFKTITQTDTHVVILIEWMHWARIVRLAAEGRPVKHVAPELRSLGGDSIGWWEGDTLVVDTTGFLRSPREPYEGLHVVEHFRRIDRDSLLYEFTVEDPDRTAAYSGSLPLPAADQRLYEYACHEGNYAMGNMLRGARLLEKEYYEMKGKDNAPKN